MRLHYRLLGRATNLLFHAGAYFIAFRDDTHPDEVLWRLGRRVARQITRENPTMDAVAAAAGCQTARAVFPRALVEGYLSVFDPITPSRAFEEGALAASMKFLQNPDLPPVLLMVRFAKDQTSFGDGVRWQCRREEAEAAREEALAR